MNENNNSANFREDIKQAQEEISKMGERYDKTLVTLVAGTIGLSVTLVLKWEGNVEKICLLTISWLLLLLALIIVMSSILIASWLYREHRHILTLFVNKKLTNEIYEKYKSKMKWNAKLYKLNISALVFFVLGVLLLMVFALVNLSEGDKIMSEKDKKETTRMVEREKLDEQFAEGPPDLSTVVAPNAPSEPSSPSGGESSENQPDTKEEK